MIRVQYSPFESQWNRGHSCVETSVYLPKTYPTVMKSNFLSRIKWDPSMKEHFHFYIVPAWRRAEVDDDDPYDEPDVPVLLDDFCRWMKIEPCDALSASAQSCTKSSGHKFEYISSAKAFQMLNEMRPAQSSESPWSFWKPFEFLESSLYWAPIEIWVRKDEHSMSEPKTFWGLQSRSESIDCTKPELFHVLAERSF